MKFFKFAGKPGVDFELWATLTEAALQAWEVYGVLESVVVGNAEDDLYSDTLVTIAKALVLIMQGPEENPLPSCMSEKQYPYSTWKCLREQYAVANDSTQVRMQMKLKRLRPEQWMSDVIDGFEEVFNRLEGMNSPYPEQLKVALFLSSFGENSKSPCGPVVAALQISSQTLTWENFTARMLQEYEEKQHDKEDSGSVSGIGGKALMASKRGAYVGRKTKGSEEMLLWWTRISCQQFSQKEQTRISTSSI